jgi:hypothetical protein
VRPSRAVLLAGGSHPDVPPGPGLPQAELTRHACGGPTAELSSAASDTADTQVDGGRHTGVRVG